MTMFGKDDDPFKAGKEEQGPSFTGGEGHACERPERLWACEGAAGILRLCPHMRPGFAGGSFLMIKQKYRAKIDKYTDKYDANLIYCGEILCG